MKDACFRLVKHWTNRVSLCVENSKELDEYPDIVHFKESVVSICISGFVYASVDISPLDAPDLVRFLMKKVQPNLSPRLIR